MKKGLEVYLIDGGVVADIKCRCGQKMKRFSMWGLVYKRKKKGTIISNRNQKEVDNIRTCKKCKRKYILVALPDIAYKEIIEKK